MKYEEAVLFKPILRTFVAYQKEQTAILEVYKLISFF